MGIKVKHDGNVTSRVFASAAGGKGKRRAEDAIRLAQLQASAAGRGGGTGGGGGASAHPTLTHAQTSSASLMAAPGALAPSIQLEKMREEAQTKRDEANFKRDLDEWTRRHDITRTDAENDRETANEEWTRRQQLLNEQEEKNDLTKQGQRERAALVDEVVRAVREGRYGKDEIPKLIESYKEAEDRIRLADSLREREPTAQEQFEQSVVTDANGNRFYKNSKGDYVPLPDPAAEAQKKQDAERQKLESEQQKAAQKREEERQKFVRDYVLKKAKDDDDFKLDAAVKEANALFEEVSGVGAPPATPTGTMPQTVVSAPTDTPSVAKTVEDAKKKWGVKR